MHVRFSLVPRFLVLLLFEPHVDLPEQQRWLDLVHRQFGRFFNVVASKL